jgi:hypothetical protein
LTNCQPGEALLYTPPNAFEIVPAPESDDEPVDSEIDGVCPFCDEAAR